MKEVSISDILNKIRGKQSRTNEPLAPRSVEVDKQNLTQPEDPELSGIALYFHGQAVHHHEQGDHERARVYENALSLEKIILDDPTLAPKPGEVIQKGSAFIIPVEDILS